MNSGAMSKQFDEELSARDCAAGSCADHDCRERTGPDQRPRSQWVTVRRKDVCQGREGCWREELFLLFEQRLYQRTYESLHRLLRKRRAC